MNDRNSGRGDGADAQVGGVGESKAPHHSLIESVKPIRLLEKGAELLSLAEKKCGGVALESAIALRGETGFLKAVCGLLARAERALGPGGWCRGTHQLTQSLQALLGSTHGGA